MNKIKCKSFSIHSDNEWMMNYYRATFALYLWFIRIDYAASYLDTFNLSGRQSFEKRCCTKISITIFFKYTPLPLYNKNKIECNWNLNGNCSHLKNLPKHRKRVCIQLFQATLGSCRYLEEQGFEQKRVDKFKIKCMCSWWSENFLGLNFWPKSKLLEGVFQSNTSAENQLRF